MTTNKTYYKQLCGRKCYLSPIDISDAEIYCKWLNDLSLSVNLSSPMHLTPDVERDLIIQLRSGSNKVFSIVNSDTNTLIGGCGLHDIDYINKSAMFGIFIGDEHNQRKGFGTEATQLILSYAFSLLNLHSIYLFVYEYNQGAIEMYKRIGFKQTGVKRQAKWLSNKYYDVVIMDIIFDEFKPIKLTQNLPV